MKQNVPQIPLCFGEFTVTTTSIINLPESRSTSLCKVYQKNFKKKKKKNLSCGSKMIWLEAVLPLGIIAGMLCVMGNAQYYIHKAAHGRPKHIGNDMWDVAMERRDKKLVEKLYAGET